MIRHISIFFFKYNVQENEKIIVENALIKLGEELLAVSDYHVKKHCLPLPPAKAKNAPEFGDLIQVIDFKNNKDAENYPHHPEHIKLIEETSPYIKKVTAFDLIL